MMTKRILAAAVFSALVAGCASGAKEESISLKQLPPAVQSGVEKSFPGAKIAKIEKEVYPDGLVHYEVELILKDGTEKEAEFAADGDLLDKH